MLHLLAGAHPALRAFYRIGETGEIAYAIKNIKYWVVIKSFFSRKGILNQYFCYVRSRPATGKIVPKRTNRIMNSSMK